MSQNPDPVRVSPADLKLILDLYEKGDTTVYPEAEAALERLFRALDAAQNAESVPRVSIPDGEVPSPGDIAARIDLGCACYHEINCSWMLYASDESLFSEEPPCDCGGEEMAKAYAELDTAAQNDSSGS